MLVECVNYLNYMKTTIKIPETNIDRRMEEKLMRTHSLIIMGSLIKRAKRMNRGKIKGINGRVETYMHQ